MIFLKVLFSTEHLIKNCDIIINNISNLTKRREEDSLFVCCKAVKNKNVNYNFDGRGLRVDRQDTLPVNMEIMGKRFC